MHTTRYTTIIILEVPQVLHYYLFTTRAIEGMENHCCHRRRTDCINKSAAESLIAAFLSGVPPTPEGWPEKVIYPIYPLDHKQPRLSQYYCIVVVRNSYITQSGKFLLFCIILSIHSFFIISMFVAPVACGNACHINASEYSNSSSNLPVY